MVNKLCDHEVGSVAAPERIIRYLSQLAEASVDLKSPSYSPINHSSSHEMSSSVARPSDPDAPSNFTTISTQELAPNPSLARESTTSRNTTTPSSPGPSSQQRLVSSMAMSATPEIPPISATPEVQLSPIEILKSQIAKAKAKETGLRTALWNAYKKESRLLQEAQDAREKAKARDLSAKKIRAETKILKARAQDLEKEVKGLKSIRPDLEEEVDEATHERTDLERQLEDMKYEEMLAERYRDPVIRKLIRRIDKDYDLNEILESFMAQEGKLRDVEALEAKLDSVCEEDSRGKAEILGAERGTPDGEDIKEEDMDRGAGVYLTPSACDIWHGTSIHARKQANGAIVTKTVPINTEAGMYVNVNSTDISVKLEPDLKVEPNANADGIGGSHTEMELRARLRNYKAAVQALRDSTHWLVGGKRKREDEK